MRFEVGVVGGGAIGLSCAWRLAQKGARVALYEQNRVGKAATHAAGGMLAAQSERAGHPLAHGSPQSRDAFFQACLQSRSLYPDFASELLELCKRKFPDGNIMLSQGGSSSWAYPTPDWRRPGILFIADHESPAERERIAHEFNAQKQAGLSVERRTFKSASSESPAFWLPDEGQVESQDLAPALRGACEKAGVQIFERARVRHEGGDWTMNGEPLPAEQVLVCGGAWSGLLWDKLSRPLAGQMIVLMDPDHAVQHIHYGSRAYLIPRWSGAVLVGATEEERGFDARATAAGAQVLLNAALEMHPHLGECAFVNHWAGLRPASPDGLPSVGRLDERSWCATGHGRNGILLCPWTAQAIAEAMLEGAALPGAFDPGRFETP